MRRSHRQFQSRPILLGSILILTITTGCFREGVRDGQAERDREKLQSLAADEAAIRAASTAWSQASTAKDLDKSIAVYTEDAMQMSPKGPAVRGKDAIRKLWTQVFAVPGPGLSFQTTSVEVARSGEIAYETGTYDFATTGKNGRTNDEKGKYVVVWKKQGDGLWKAAVDIDNTDQ